MNETIFAVDPKEGDAHEIMTIGHLDSKLIWDVFKAKYKHLWKPAEDRERVLLVYSNG